MAITTNGGAGVTADAVATLSNKTLASPIINNATFTGQQSGLQVAFNDSIVFEGTTADAYETTLSAGDPTADRVVTLPNATTTLVGTDTTDTLSNKTFSASTANATMASLMGYTSTATAAGTTTLTATSSYYQQFTGTTTQTVQLPVTSTLATGWTFHIVNNSTGIVSIVSSGSNAVLDVPAGTTAMVTCISTSGTTASSWESGITDFSTVVGSGSAVMVTGAGTSGYVLTSTGTGTQWAAASSGGVSANDQAFAFAVQVFA